MENLIRKLFKPELAEVLSREEASNPDEGNVGSSQESSPRTDSSQEAHDGSVESQDPQEESIESLSEEFSKLYASAPRGPKALRVQCTYVSSTGCRCPITTINAELYKGHCSKHANSRTHVKCSHSDCETLVRESYPGIPSYCKTHKRFASLPIDYDESKGCDYLVSSGVPCGRPCVVGSTNYKCHIHEGKISKLRCTAVVPTEVEGVGIVEMRCPNLTTLKCSLCIRHRPLYKEFRAGRKVVPKLIK